MRLHIGLQAHLAQGLGGERQGRDAEDTVLAELECYRAGSEISDCQWGDIVGVLKVQAPEIDLAYLRQWAPLLGVADLLDRALDDAGLG